MELKQQTHSYHQRQGRVLLIVPYGIETWYYKAIVLNQFCLLIVPYGIETFVDMRHGYRALILLIVPYGIETYIYAT